MWQNVTDDYNTLSIALAIQSEKHFLSAAQRCKTFAEFKESIANVPSVPKKTANGVSFWVKNLNIKQLDLLIASL